MLPVCDKTSTKGKWETDLGCVYEQVDWHYLLEQAQTVLISTKHRQIQFNIYHRAYYTPYRLHKIDSYTSSRCQKCKVTDGDLLHMLWSCPLIEETSRLAGWRRAEQATAKVSYSKTFFLVNSVYTNNVLSACVHV